MQMRAHALRTRTRAQNCRSRTLAIIPLLSPGTLSDNRHLPKTMERRRRRYGPFQAGCPIAPWIGAYAPTRQQGVERDEDEKHRRSKRDVAANGRDEVPAGESLGIVRDAPRHARKSQKVHRKKCQVDADEGGPEMDLAEDLVV